MTIWIFTTIGILSNIAIRNRSLYVIFALWLLAIAAFQQGIGGDYESYQKIFYSNIQYMQSRKIDWGFIYLMETVKFLGGDFRWLLIIIAPITIGLTSYSLWRYSPALHYSPFFAFFLFFSFLYFDYLGVLRQSLAQAIVFGGFVFLLTGHHFRFLALTILASTFHLATISAVLLFMIWRVHVTPVLFAALLIITLFFGNFFLADFLNYFAAQSLIPYSAYILDKALNGVEVSVYSKIVSMFLFFCMMFLLFLHRQFSINIYIVKLVYVYVFLRVLFIDFHFGHRVLMIFEPFLLISIASLATSSMQMFAQKRFIYVMIVCVFLAHFVMNFYIRTRNDLDFTIFQLGL